MSLLAARLDRSAATAAPGLIRPLRATDGEDLLAHYQRLDPQTRRARFGGTVGPDFLRAYARQALGDDARILGLFLDGTLRGVAELRFADASRQVAEAAFSIENGWQGRGHGARLFARLHAMALGLGVERIVFQCLRENAAMQAIVRR